MARKQGRVRREDAEKQRDEHSPKAIWRPMNLQQMPLSRFVDVVNQVLEGTHSLVTGSLSGNSSLPED